jgi:outer membrane biosynthesis protein TonB
MLDLVDGGEAARAVARMENLRRRRRATAVSLAIHGALAWLAFASLSGTRVEKPPPPVQLSTIDIDVSPRPPERPQLLAARSPGTPGTPAPARSRANAGLRGRRGHAASAPVAAPPVIDPFADLAIRYETGNRAAPQPGPGAGEGGDGPGDAARGIAGGQGIAAPLGGGIGGSLQLPSAPPVPSRARPPRAKQDYRRWAYRGASEYAGSKVVLELAIDARGRVSDVRVLQGVARHIDVRAIERARSFEFHPALDRAGAPTAGIHRWDFVIEAGDEVDFSAAL